jgi:predicted aspartyl protease
MCMGLGVALGQPSGLARAAAAGAAADAPLPLQLPGPGGMAPAAPGTAAPGDAVPGDAVPMSGSLVEPLDEIVIQARAPRYVERTHRDHIGRIWAPVFIDGQGPFRLVLDTGATRTAIVGRVVGALGARTSGEPDMRLRGVTGTATVPTIAVSRVEFGELRIPTRRLPVLRDAFGGADGVLGTEGLAGRRLYIDFINDLIHVSMSHGERAPAGFITVPFDLAGGHLLVTDARVGGIRVRMIIDTGAQVSVGNLALRDMLRRRRERVEIHSIEGVTLDEEATEQHAVPMIQIGELQLRMEYMEFADVEIFKYWHMTEKPTVLLGMDVLGRLDKLVIDYSRHELQVRLADGHGD